MKKLIEFTKNWKHRNLLHVVGGFLIGVFLSLLFSWYVSLCIVFAIAFFTEIYDEFFKSKFDLLDFFLALLIKLIIYFFN